MNVKGTVVMDYTLALHCICCVCYVVKVSNPITHCYLGFGSNPEEGQIRFGYAVHGVRSLPETLAFFMY